MVLVAMLIVQAGPDALGCPNCKDGVSTTDPDGLNVARGYFYSILFMLAMPFTLAGSFAAYVWREMRKQKRQAAADLTTAELVSAEMQPAGAAIGRTLP